MPRGVRKNSNVIEGISITPRRVEMLDLISQGFNDEEVAHKLTIETNTVRNFISNLKKDLQIPKDRHARIYILNWWLALKNSNLGA